MTLTSTTIRAQYSGDSTDVSFPITFVFWGADDLQVVLTDAAGIETEWDRGTEYTISGGNGATGTLTVSTVPTDYTPELGETLTILSNLPLTQPTSLPLGGPLPSTAIEQEFDQTVRMAQQLAERLGRTLKASISETSIDDLPPVAARALMLLGFDAAGQPVATDPAGVGDTGNIVSAYMATVLVALSAAAARTTLGLGSVAVKNTGTSGDVVPLLNALINMGDNILQRPVIKDYGETVNALGSIGGGTQDIDLTLGNVITGTIDTSTTTFTFSNPSPSGIACSFTMILTNAGSQTINWPASTRFPGGVAPVFSVSGIDIIVFLTLTGGPPFYGFLSGRGMA